MDINLMACILSDMYLPCTFMLFGFMVLKLVKVFQAFLMQIKLIIKLIIRFSVIDLSGSHGSKIVERFLKMYGY